MSISSPSTPVAASLVGVMSQMMCSCFSFDPSSSGSITPSTVCALPLSSDRFSLAIEFSASLVGLEARKVNDLLPFHRFLGDQFSHVFRRAADRLGTELAHAGDGLRL